MRIFSMRFIALLSVALVVSSAPAISANIPAILESYPTISDTFIGLVTTIPSLFLIFGVFSTNFIKKRLGTKKTIIAGLILVCFFGTLPALMELPFIVLLLSRCFLGFGIGLFNRLIIQLISQMFQNDDKKKAKALGLESAFEGFGGIFMTLLVGQLASISWRSTFFVYSFSLIGIIFISIWIPNEEVSSEMNNKELEQTPLDKKMVKKSILLGTILFAIVTLFINYNLQITPLLIEKGIGNSTEGSNMIAGIAAGAFIAGNLFGVVYSKFKHWLLPIATISAGASMLLALYSNNILLVLMASVLLGFSFRNIMPYFMHVLTNGGPRVAELGTTVVLVAYNLGATISPFLAQFIIFITNDSKASNQLIATGIALVSIGFILLLFRKNVIISNFDSELEYKKE